MAKKKKVKDFQKVKLKVGKKLPKGTNETDTSFKARKIIVGQQLKASKEDINEPITSKRLSVLELLTRVHHYNISTRMSALRGLKEMFDKHPDVINSHLSQIIEKVPLLSTDEDENIRKTTLTVIKTMLVHVNGAKIVPLYSTLAAQLSCAMSHLNPYIQFDSLFLLDVYLDFCPDIIHCTSSAELIFPNFLNLISKDKSATSDRERTLSEGPSSRLVSKNWRKHVLQRLEKLVAIILKPKEVKSVAVEVEWNSCKQKSVFSFQRQNLLPKFPLREISKSNTQKQVECYGAEQFLADVVPLLDEDKNKQHLSKKRKYSKLLKSSKLRKKSL